MMEYIKEGIFAFLGTIAFSIMINIPKKEIFYCGIAGGIGWIFYSICMSSGLSSAYSNFAGTLFITYFARLFAIIRKNPVSVFLISGIITLVPGTSIYNMALNFIMTDNDMAIFYALETIKIACGIAFGIIIVLALPQFLFGIVKSKKPLNR